MSVICAIPVLSAFFSACTPPPPLATGYVEGQYDLIAPVAVAQVDRLDVRRGARVAAGAVMVRMERRDADIALAKANAAYAQAESQLADLKQGRRPEEIAVLQAALTSARAQAENAQRELTRAQSLNDRGVAPQSNLDSARTALDVANAAVAQATANLAVAKLPARPDQIAAAEAAVAQARAARDEAAWQLGKRTLTAPAAGEVTEVLRNPGEIAGPSAPVLTFLPDGAVKLKLYMPETVIASIHVGTRLTVHCDGCGSGERATVTYVSDQPEFTPPVIYSLDNRQKLVYLVEARPDPSAVQLKPGQIVDVALPQGAQG
ncbi:MAG: HlyD family efflux transporter periplasmic adaptor subunit [Paracoccaceae bacterium]|nr:HlyD family efflux transporter periplasmic adaptor subunit [Paracoccaceae bacterium]